MSRKSKSSISERECEFCAGMTKVGRLCKRRAQCEKGCEYFCWQHTKAYGGSYSRRKSCRDPQLPECEECLPGNTYPCRIGYHSLLHSEDEMKEYCDIVGKAPYYDPEIMKRKAKKRTAEWKRLKTPKTSKPTRVRFE